MATDRLRGAIKSSGETIHHPEGGAIMRGQEVEAMIVYRTFSDTHLVHSGGRGLAKREELRQQAMNFIAEELEDQEVVCITEAGDDYASSVTVWYRD